MSAAAFALLFTGVLLNAAAQLFLKAGTNATGVITLTPSDGLATILRLATVPPILAGLACYAVSVVVWILGLSRVPVSVAYPMLSLGYVVNAFAGYSSCPRTYAACVLRGLDMLGRGLPQLQPMRFGGFPGAGRA